MHRTIRIQIASDLHLEMFRKPFPNWYRVDRLEADRADLLVLAGDIHNGVEAIRCFADWPIPVLYVPGNHEYYETRIDPGVSNIIDIFVLTKSYDTQFRQWLAGKIGRAHV